MQVIAGHSFAQNPEVPPVFTSGLLSARLYITKSLLSYHLSHPSLRYADSPPWYSPGTCQACACLRDFALIVPSTWTILSPDIHMVNSSISVFNQLSLSQGCIPWPPYFIMPHSYTSLLHVFPLSYTSLTLPCSFYSTYHPPIFYIIPVLFC